MELEQAIKILSYHSRWRRDNENKYELISPNVIGEAIDVVVEYHEKYPTKKKIYEYGLEVFNLEIDKFNRWLKKSNISLGKRPEDLMETEEGRLEVMKCLNRIEYGNFN